MCLVPFCILFNFQFKIPRSMFLSSCAKFFFTLLQSPFSPFLGPVVRLNQGKHSAPLVI